MRVKESVLQDLVPSCKTVVQEEIVDEGNTVTADGMAASIDLGLYVVECIAVPATRLRITTQMDYPYSPNKRIAANVENNGVEPGDF